MAILKDQADRTVAGVSILVQWLRTTPHQNPNDLVRIEQDVDVLRHAMEEKLISSFSTPFDRQDIYSISRQMDYILNSSKETALEMYAFGVVADPPILAMAQYLHAGTFSIAEAIRVMNTDRERAEELIRQGREEYHRIEDMYITGMAKLFKTSDPMDAMKTLEIYHHLRYAGRALRDTLDILHNALIDLA
ncbi:MAG TPA: DUF47 family protein [Methanoregulaceae archaeon]|nr:DUF47 family protein [Methanoregulaceae archaeon]HPD76510.1 DUF47 family protein [Methanoregulaceae archaeon]HRY75855.1 DUF47 family protein [Methanoregulaceae archaeon]